MSSSSSEINKTAYIFGSGGHSRVVASILHGKYREIVFVGLTAADTIITEEVFFGRWDAATSDVFIGIGSNRIRRRVYDVLKGKGISLSNCISDFAFVANDAKLGEGVTVCPGSVVGSRSVIGDNTIINTLSSVDHDGELGDHSQITVGVTVAGGVSIGKNCFLGAKSAVVPGITIADNAKVMAGSVVLEDVQSLTQVGGNPAVVVKTLDESRM